MKSVNLQDIWANLLANATDPRELTQVRTMFPVGGCHLEMKIALVGRTVSIGR
jgi:hypothetical protein